MQGTGKVWIKLDKAVNVPVGDYLTGSCDPFFKIQLKCGDDVIQEVQTPIIRRTLNPIFNSEFVFPLQASDKDISLHFDLYDYDRLKSPDYLGDGTLSISRQQNNVSTAEVALSKRGTLHVTYRCYLAVLAPQSIKNSYKQFNHSLIHLMREGSVDKGNAGFSVFQVEMKGVGRFFGDKYQGWNKNYEAAQKIFGSAAIKASISVQHNKLYGSYESTDTGVLSSGDELLALIKYGVYGARKRFFTYALTDDVWNFAETGKEFTKDFTSKHAMHGSCAEELRYAGEFHVIEENGEHTLVLDSNSGTYGPDAAMLPALKECFEYNFPGLRVKVLHWDSDELKACQKAVADYNETVPVC